MRSSKAENGINASYLGRCNSLSGRRVHSLSVSKSPMCDCPPMPGSALNYTLLHVAHQHSQVPCGSERWHQVALCLTRAEGSTPEKPRENLDGS